MKGWITETNETSQTLERSHRRLKEKCEYLSPVLYHGHQMWAMYLQYTDGHWLFLHNEQLSGELNSGTTHERNQELDYGVSRGTGCWGRRSCCRSSWTTVSWTESWFPVIMFSGLTCFDDKLIQFFVDYGFTRSETWTCSFFFEPTSDQLLQRSNRKRPDWKHDCAVRAMSNRCRNVRLKISFCPQTETPEHTLSASLHEIDRFGFRPSVVVAVNDSNSPLFTSLVL